MDKSAGASTKAPRKNNLRSMIVAVCGLALIGAACGPRIDVWYGKDQTFGQSGRSQELVNVVGNVSDPEGVSSLSYTLNGGAESHLSIGPDKRRLAEPGDFNVEVPYSQLNNGANTVVIKATDGEGNISEKTVTVNAADGNPTLPFTTNFGSNSNPQAHGQVVDGPWSIENGELSNDNMDYDRSYTIGDVDWTEYEVTVPVTLHEFGDEYMTPESGNQALLGMGLRWRGHTNERGEQPNKLFFPTGAFIWYEWFSSHERWNLYGNNFSPKDTYKAAEPQIGAKQWMKVRVENVAGGTQYSFKTWVAGSAEPSTWHADIVVEDGPSSGGIVLLAHHLDASFGNVTVNPI